MPEPQIESRAAEIVAALSREKKISLLSGRDLWHLEAIASAGIPALTITDGPHGLRKQGGDESGMNFADTVPATCFPPAATLACSWDPSLAEDVGGGVDCDSHRSVRALLCVADTSRR